uniref:Uncharacterized protein n=1 Tax=Ananas comosus var. bracteatus TaxID=296719 RepID=A0A6V7P1T2_ANACO|nr:unnamed protein product [Ananas comosus var. bracteatus]
MLELPPALRWHKLDYTCFIPIAFLIYLTLLGLVVHCAESLPHRARLGTAERASPRASSLARDVSIGGLPLIGFILERLRVVPCIETTHFTPYMCRHMAGLGTHLAGLCRVPGRDITYGIET